MIEGWTRRWNGPCAKPQSVLAITCSPSYGGGRSARCARPSSGCSTVGGVADDPRHQHGARRKLRFFHPPLVLVARVGRFDEVGARAGAQDEIHDVFQRYIARVRAGPAAPAHVVADTLRRNALGRAVDGLHLAF